MASRFRVTVEAFFIQGWSEDCLIGNNWESIYGTNMQAKFGMCRTVLSSIKAREVTERTFCVLTELTIWVDKAYQQTGIIRGHFRESVFSQAGEELRLKGGFPCRESQIGRSDSK